jgi:hypothetical protein
VLDDFIAGLRVIAASDIMLVETGGGGYDDEENHTPKYPIEVQAAASMVTV